MDNQDFNQLPMLPDPTDQSAALTPATSTATPPAAPMSTKKPVRNKYLRFGVTAAVFVAVMLLVFFGQHIGELFHLFGTKAGQTAILDSSNFFQGDWSQTDSHGVPSNNCFTTSGGKLTLNDPGDGSCSP